MQRDKVREALAQGAPPGLDFYYADEDAAAFWRRAGSAPEWAAVVEEIRAEGGRLLGEPAPELTYSLFAIFADRGTRLEYEHVYFVRRRRLNTFALLALLEPDERAYLAALCDIVWSVCNEYTWCLPAHLSGSGAAIRSAIDLFSAETGFALTEIALLLGDRLPPLLRERIAEEVEARLFTPYLTRGPYGWETARHNWAAVCAGSIGAAALLAIRDADRLAEIIGKVLGSMDHFLAGFGEDGACLEGLDYWSYGFGYFVYFADLLDKRTKGALDLLSGGKVRRIAQFQQKVYLDGDRVANFSDAAPRAHFQAGLACRLARRFPEVEVPPLSMAASYREDHCSRWAPALRNLIWLDPRQGGGGGRRAADDYWPDAQWLISRHRSAAGAFSFAAKAGHNAEPHNHNDIGQFMLLADGETFVADLGSGEYTKEYFGAGRYTYDCNGSQGHAVPIVDGALQEAGEESAARVLEAAVGGEEVRFRFEMAAAYRLPHLQSLVRSFAWRKRELPVLELTDEFRFAEAPGSVIERIIALRPPEPMEGGVVRLAGAGRRSVLVRYDAERLHVRVERRSYRDHRGREECWYALDFVLAEAVGSRCFAIVLKFEFA